MEARYMEMEECFERIFAEMKMLNGENEVLKWKASGFWQESCTNTDDAKKKKMHYVHTIQRDGQEDGVHVLGLVIVQPHRPAL